MHILRILILGSLVLGSLWSAPARAKQDQPEAPAAPDAPRLVLFEAFTRYG